MDRSHEIVKYLLKQKNTPWYLVGLAIDDRPVHIVMEKGSIDYEIREAIKQGIDIVTAYQMGTINNAVHWRKTGDIGSISPGRLADIVIIDDLEKVSIDKVIADGHLVVNNGQLINNLCYSDNPSYICNTVNLNKEIKAEDFKVHCLQDYGEVDAVILIPLYFEEDLNKLIKKLPCENNIVLRDLQNDICKAAIIERHKGTGNIGVSFWQIGFKRGAVAMSFLHDSHNISVVGASDEDMALASNRLVELGGGIEGLKKMK